MPFVLPELSFASNALEPYIDSQTVDIHYGKHHATYLKNLNAALEKYPVFADKTIDQILTDLSLVPEDIRSAVRNNGGGFYNHNLYWEMMGKTDHHEPEGKLADAIKKSFGGFVEFKAEMEKGGLGRFGSGYAWLSIKKDGEVIIHSTPNQDCPLTEGLYPLLVVDVWEHAYYLKYQNRRAEYLSNWWNVVNWKNVQTRFEHFNK
jgi:superoxide dismutase, Fe-Mn family